MSEPKLAEPANEHAKRLRTLPCNSHWEVKVLSAAAAEIERLAARVRELERDAGRYSFLRGQNWTDGTLTVTMPSNLAVGAATYSGERLDEKLDWIMRTFGAGQESKADQETSGQEETR